MSFYNRNSERKRIPHEFRRQDEEVVRSLCRLGSRPISPRSMQEQEKRIRREIANSNERRRMQSINAGFQFLRNLLPQREGEKLSKANILQQTADYIYQLEKEKACLLEQNSQLKRAVINSQNNQDSDGSSDSPPFPKKKKHDIGDSIDEGIRSSSPAHDTSLEDMRREILELRLNLEHERSIRIHLEEQIQKLESQRTVPDTTYDIALRDHLSYHSSPENATKQRLMNAIVENRNRSSKLNASNIELDNFHEVPVSPELPADEVPEDLSGKYDSSLHSYRKEVSVSNCNIIPGSNLSPHCSPPAFSLELEVTSQHEPYRPTRCRSNLETIVEAIRHVEGDHMFRDDPLPSESPKQENEPEKTVVKKELYDEERVTPQIQHLHAEQTFSLQHQIIRNAPVSQSRPGVIVSKLS